MISSQDNISLLACDGSVLVGLNDNGVAYKCCKAVNMGSEFDFEKISLFDGC